MKRLLTIAGVFVALSAGAQQDMDNVKIRSVPVADGLYMLLGAGGNIGLFAGDDGVFMIDDQFAPLTPKIMPGHGQLSNRAELKEFHDMLVESRDRVQAMLDDGKTPDEIVADAPLADLDARWSSGFIDGEGFTRAILAGLTEA